MKSPDRSATPPRFQAPLKHYHRSGPAQPTWQQWADPKQRPGKRWGRIIGILLALAALGGIIAGLAVEMSR